MRYTRNLIKIFAGVAIVAATAAVSFAGVNPAGPGLPSVTVTSYGGGALANNQLSGMCVACHTRTPYGTGATAATHFVFDDNHHTNTGGGWTSADYSKTGTPRNGAQYFRVTAWSTAGNYSKYGNFTSKLSEVNTNATVGYELATKVAATAAAIQTDEVICESCHNIVRNVAGGNNLLELPGDTLGTAGPLAYADSKVATLCVGCHGWLYDASAVNTDCNSMTNGAYADNLWTMVGEAGAIRKDSNGADWKSDGVKHLVNHHVMSGDKRNLGIANANLNWTPTTTFDVAQAHTMDTTVRAGSYALKLRTNWGAGFTPLTGAVTNFSCLACHTNGHGGSANTGASILRGTAFGSSVTGTQSLVINRINDGRSWKDQDANAGSGTGNWCQNCHQN